MVKKSKVLGGVLLVAGTTIGAGMLAMPVSTGGGGFLPSCVLLLIVWLCMLFTAFLMLEVNLWMSGDSNIITMAKHTLGKVGQAITWIVYLLLLYSLTAAYIVGCAPLILHATSSLTGHEMPFWVGTIPLLVVFGSFVYLGTKAVDWINRLLMTGLVLSYTLMLSLILPHVDPELLMYENWKVVWPATTVVVTSFGYHIIIPSLTTYLERDVKKLRVTVLIGSTVPLAVYFLWQAAILGAIPAYGEGGLLHILELNQPTAHLTHALDKILNSQWVTTASRFFAFFAVVTSFLGVSLSLSDFLADGLKIKKTEKGKIITCALTFAPPLIFALAYPQGFIIALKYAGVLVAVLLILLPVAMVWIGRYRKGYVGPFRTWGGKPAMALASIIALVVIAIELI